MKNLIALLCLVISTNLKAETGYELWLRYEPLENKQLLEQYRKQVTGVIMNGNSATIRAAREEIVLGLEGLLNKKVTFSRTPANNNIIIGTPATSTFIAALPLRQELQEAGEQGYVLLTTQSQQKNILVITGNSDLGVLYGVFHFLRLIQTAQPIHPLNIVSAPKIKNRILNHWDNLDRTVERGYAGFSIWDWHKLPDYIDQRYIDYARANASIGINGTVLTNVNANALILTPDFLKKVAALANTFRPYGLKVYLTARFSAPIEIGKLKTADPLDALVQQWWKDKAKEIYGLIPDFGGFLVKANSEGQPGPQNYKRTHADGANALADAVSPFGGLVMWRAFVYSNETPDDRFKQAYNEFKPLDGKFRENVLIQVKNGPIDFQPREPFHPLFGAMDKTPVMMEFQITQEYLGQATNLVFLPTLFIEALTADTHLQGTVANVIDGTSSRFQTTAIAGVANIGNDINWTGHPFGQANWYGYGRLAWDHGLSARTIADEWIRQTFSNQPGVVQDIKSMMLASREIMVSYMTPLGLNHIMGYGHHYGPAPWYDRAPRADWNPVYFHKADSIGIGFDRTEKGSNALAQYAPEIREKFGDPKTCPEDYLLWFHHVPWTFRMRSGRTLWEELCAKYNAGVDSVRWMQRKWNAQRNLVDKERFNQVRMLLAIQEKEAVWWRNSCLQYFQTFSKMPIPAKYEKPDQTLEYYKNLRFTLAPG